MSIISEILRSNPKFQIILNESYLEVIDEDDKVNNGQFLLENIDSLQFIPSKINWIISILSLITDIVMSGAGSGSYKKDAKLIFNYNGLKKEIFLLDCNEDKSKQIISTIKSILDKRDITSDSP